MNRTAVAADARAGELVVTVHKLGLLSLDGSTFVAIGEPRAVELRFDAEYHAIELQPVDPAFAEYHVVRRAIPGASGPFLIPARTFLHHYDIHLPRTLRSRADLDSGVLRIVLGNCPKPAPPARHLHLVPDTSHPTPN
jgi:hypothetical protein